MTSLYQLPVKGLLVMMEKGRVGWVVGEATINTHFQLIPESFWFNEGLWKWLMLKILFLLNV